MIYNIIIKGKQTATNEGDKEMTEYNVTMAKKKDIDKYYAGYNMFMNTIEIIVEAKNREEAFAKVKGYKGMVGWKAHKIK